MVLIVCCLNSCGVSPVDFQLLHNMVVASGVSELGLDAAHFLVAHLDLKTIPLQNLERFFERGSDRSCRSLPVLFLQHLGRGELLSVRVVIRRFDPEFQFGRRCDVQPFDFIDAVDVHIIEDIWILLQELQQVLLEVKNGVTKYHSGPDSVRLIVDQTGRDAERADRKTGFRVRVVEVVVHEPVDRSVRNNVDFSVVQIRDLRQHNGRTVCLHAVFQEALDVSEKLLYRDLFVCVIASYIDTYHRYKFNLRVGLKGPPDFFFTVLCSRYRVEHSVKIKF